MHCSNMRTQRLDILSENAFSDIFFFFNSSSDFKKNVELTLICQKNRKNEEF